MRHHRRLRPYIHRFAKHQQGGVLIMTAISIVLLIVVASAALELGTQQMVKNRLQQATDAAGLAAAALPVTASDEERKNTALRYFNLNFPDSYLGVKRPTLTVTFSPDSIIVTTNDVEVPTMVMNSSGTSSSTISGSSSTIGFADSGEAQRYDVMLVLDNSGSMKQTDGGSITRMQALKNASNVLIDDLLSNGQDNRMAAVSWDVDVIATQPFTNSATSMHNFINGMTERGGTNSDAGLSAALDFTSSAREDDVVKVVILLTDGVNGGFGYNPPITTPDVNTKSLATSVNIKGKSFLLYTIAFGEDINKPQCKFTKDGKEWTFANIAQSKDPVYCPRPFLAHVASGIDPNKPDILPNGKYQNEDVFYFVAPTPTELEAIFNNIRTSIRKLRILG